MTSKRVYKKGIFEINGLFNMFQTHSHIHIRRFGFVFLKKKLFLFMENREKKAYISVILKL